MLSAKKLNDSGVERKTVSSTCEWNASFMVGYLNYLNKAMDNNWHKQASDRKNNKLQLQTKGNLIKYDVVVSIKNEITRYREHAAVVLNLIRQLFKMQL